MIAGGNAGEAVRQALLAALKADPLFAGVGSEDGGGEQLPSLRTDAAQVADWSTKDAVGREVRTSIALRVASGQAERLPDLVAAAEAAGEALSGSLNGWHVASAVLLRSASFAPEPRIRAALVEHRVRVLET